MRESLERATQEYQKQFENTLEGLTYWEERGLSPALASQLRIGFVAEPLPGDYRFRGSLVIPYLQPAGVTFMKFRRLGDGPGPKYDAVSGLTARIYNTPILSRVRELVITEGEIDCATFLELGIPAVAVPGATSWKREYNRIFRNRLVTVFCDGDEAGRKMGSTLTNELMGCRMIEAPDGEDANSCYLKYGADWLREKVGR